jgi:hypothetical protein
MAKTEPIESYSIENCQWYTEYAVRKVDKESERDDLIKHFGTKELWSYSNPYSAIRRRVNVINNMVQYMDWEIIDFGDGIHDAAKKMGDSKYWNNAISLSDIHQEIVKNAKLINELLKELNQLKDQITPHKFERRSLLQTKYEEKYITELKSRKLYTKFKHDNVSMDVLNLIREKLKNEYTLELEQINNKITEIEQKIIELNK